MTAAVKEVLAYLLARYPEKADLSNARVTKMVYLADWKHALEHGTQLTSIKWKFDNFGPFVWAVKDEAKRYPELFKICQTTNEFGSNKIELSLLDEKYRPDLSESQQKVVQHVIDQTVDLSYQAFIKLVYSTFPIVASKRYEHLDLVVLAQEYKAIPF